MLQQPCIFFMRQNMNFCFNVKNGSFKLLTFMSNINFCAFLQLTQTMNWNDSWSSRCCDFSRNCGLWNCVLIKAIFTHENRLWLTLNTRKKFLSVLVQFLLKTTWVCTKIEIIIKWTTMAKLYVPHSLMA